MSTNLNKSDERLDAALRQWQTPPSSPWLAGRIAAGIASNRTASSFSLFPGPLKARVAALLLAVIVGWGAGAILSVPEAAADDGIELADILW